MQAQEFPYLGSRKPPIAATPEGISFCDGVQSPPFPPTRRPRVVAVEAAFAIGRRAQPAWKGKAKG